MLIINHHVIIVLKTGKISKMRVTSCLQKDSCLSYSAFTQNYFFFSFKTDDSLCLTTGSTCVAAFVNCIYCNNCIY